MMTERDNGGPAFPLDVAVGAIGEVYHSGDMFPSAEGMSLRDWFAGQALAGIANGDNVASTGFDDVIEHLAVCAYKCADAMLKERAK